MEELSQEDRALADGLRKRDGAFLFRLGLRFVIVVLLLVWLLVDGPGAGIGRWAAEGFGTLTGTPPPE